MNIPKRGPRPSGETRGKSAYVAALLMYTAFISATAVLARPPNIPDTVFRPADVVTIATASDLVVARWDDGTVGAWKLGDGSLLSRFNATEPGYHLTEVSMMLSGTAPPRLALELYTTGLRSQYAVVTYDLSTATKVGLIQAPRMMPSGISTRGDELLCASPWGDLEAMALSPENGKELWSVKLPDKGHSSWVDGVSKRMTDNGDLVVDFYNDRIVARDRKGKEFWKIDRPEGCRLTSTALVAVADHVVVFDATGKNPCALNLVDGTTIWKGGGIDLLSVRAVAPDATKLALFHSGQVEVHLMPADNIVQLPRLDGKQELKFTGDGKRVLALPHLSVVSEDEAARASPTHT